MKIKKSLVTFARRDLVAKGGEKPDSRHQGTVGREKMQNADTAATLGTEGCTRRMRGWH